MRVAKATFVGHMLDQSPFVSITSSFRLLSVGLAHSVQVPYRGLVSRLTSPKLQQVWCEHISGMASALTRLLVEVVKRAMVWSMIKYIMRLIRVANNEVHWTRLFDIRMVSYACCQTRRSLFCCF